MCTTEVAVVFLVSCRTSLLIDNCIFTPPGTWLLDLASSRPPPASGSHEFVGTDLNPAPFPSSTPPNVTFAVQDIKKPWPESQHGQFDLVHQRLTLLSAGSNPSASITHLGALVKPGGWIQISEGTMDFPPDVVSEERTPVYCDMLRLMRAVAGAVGAEWHLGRTLNCNRWKKWEGLRSGQPVGQLPRRCQHIAAAQEKKHAT